MQFTHLKPDKTVYTGNRNTENHVFSHRSEKKFIDRSHSKSRSVFITDRHDKSVYRWVK